ncbi:MAG: sensor histidine kinase [Jatrophihabitans sp.]|uniref:sensor histidine kinase n=1 Tax=Jatrophihabitans sp. TaxID=1932789 RepID=UPI003915DB07
MNRSARGLRLPQRWGDTLLAAVLLAVGQTQVWLGWTDGGIGIPPHGRHLARAALLVGLTMPLAWRRRQPLATVTAVCLAISVQLLVVVAYVPLLTGLLPMAIANYTAAAYAPRWRVASLPLVFAAEAFIYARIPEERVGGEVVFAVFVLLGTWVVGDVVRQRWLRAERAEGAAEAMVAEREAASEAALAEERTRIARELHDVISHTVSVMAVQAGAARTLLDTEPDAARAALLSVEAAARSAVGELQRLLTVLRDDDAAPDRNPQPGLGQLRALVDQVRTAGLPVELNIIELPPLSPGVDLAAFRIVQESLTNALKHAGAATTVTVDHTEAGLHIEVRDLGPGRRANGSGGGHGLIGMRERAQLYGGVLRAADHPDGGFVVDLQLPTGTGVPA